MTIAMTLLPGRFWSPLAARGSAPTGASRGWMTAMLGRMRARARERARFRELRDEIARMPDDIALDLRICRGDAEDLAWRAVYGR
jgi:hypothetical protein